MNEIWIWILLFLLVFGIAALPNWRHRRGRGTHRRRRKWPYAPALAAMTAFMIIVALAWFGFIAIALG